MKCIFCGASDSKVIDSRLTTDGSEIRRRRECIVCARRFSTHEVGETTPLLVVKSSGVREAFSPSKIKAGIIKACEKRPVPAAKIDALVTEISRTLYNSLEQEVSSKKIGEMVMNGLKNIDEVSYIRFASVYRQFRDIESFIRELEEMLSGKAAKPAKPQEVEDDENR